MKQQKEKKGQKDLFLARMDDLADKAAKTGRAASRFLSPAEAQRVAGHFRHRRDVTLCLDGGYEGAERVRAIFLPCGSDRYDRAVWFAALQAEGRAQDAPGHRDILGALMALGVERDTVGDIAAGPPATIIVLPELSGHIAENVTKIGRAGVTLTEIGLDALAPRAEALTVKTGTVASLRLDAVLCAAFGLSRAGAAELISAGRVSLNHDPCLQPAKELDAGALLSVRGLGRAKLLEVGGLSKKGRIRVRFGLYGR